MDPANGVYPIVLLLGAAHGVFLALALVISGRGRLPAHLFLAGLTLTFAADLGVDYLYRSGTPVRLPALARIEDVTSFLYGPLAYFYVVALTTKRAFRLSCRFWLHMLPIALSAVLVVGLETHAEDIRPAVTAGSSGVREFAESLIEFTPLPLIGGYLFACFRKLARHERNVRDQFSSLDRVSLIWVRNLLFALVALYLLYAFAILLPFPADQMAPLEALLDLSIVCVIYTMGFLGLRQPAIFSRGGHAAPAEVDLLMPAPATDARSARARPKYRKSALDPASSALLLQDLEQFIDSERPYLDSTLTLSRLAEQTGFSSNYLSQAINEHTGNNFFDFINRHRLETAKRLLADPEQVGTSILTIAMSAGFNSKSAFYTAFKQHTGLTPGQFRKSVQEPPSRAS